MTTYHERDRETGLDYRGARFYDSDVCRFLSLDPLAADFADMSPYYYVLGNPIIFIDPDGRAPVHGDDPPIQCGDAICLDDGTEVYASVNEAEVSASRLIKVKAGYLEGGADVGFGVSFNLLSLRIPEKNAAAHGSFDGGKEIQISGITLTGSIAPSVEVLGVTAGNLKVEGFNDPDIVGNILRSNIQTHSASAGEILNGKITKVTSQGTTKINELLIGASLGAGVSPVDGDTALGTMMSSSKVIGGPKTTRDTLEYIDRNPGNPRLDSIKNVIQQRLRN